MTGGIRRAPVIRRAAVKRLSHDFFYQDYRRRTMVRVIFVEQLKAESVFRRASARCSEDLRLEASLEATLQARSDNRPV